MEYTRNPETSMTVAVVEAVSAFENRDPTALPTLHDTVDADALSAIFDSGSDATDGRSRSVSFRFSDSKVTIENGQRILVEAAPPTPTAHN